MKGIINKGIQELVETEFGGEVWDEIRAQAGCDEMSFSPAVDYPDTMTTALIEAASTTLGLSPDEVMLEFGRFIVPNTLKTTYRALFAMAGENARDFLKNLDRIHREVTATLPHAKPPSLHTEELPDGRLAMLYVSERHLCPALRGLIEGVGIHFGEKLEVQEETCTRTGADACRMLITFDGS